MFKELWIRGTQNEKRTLSEEPIREILRSITSAFKRVYRKLWEATKEANTNKKKRKWVYSRCSVKIDSFNKTSSKCHSFRYILRFNRYDRARARTAALSAQGQWHNSLRGFSRALEFQPHHFALSRWEKIWKIKRSFKPYFSRFHIYSKWCQSKWWTQRQFSSNKRNRLTIWSPQTNLMFVSTVVVVTLTWHLSSSTR